MTEIFKIKIYFAAAGIVFFLAVFLSPSLSVGKTVINKKGQINVNPVRIVLALPTGGRFKFFTKQFINGLLLNLNKRGGLNIKYSIINLPVSAGGKSIGEMFDSFSKKGISAVIGPLFEGQLKYFASDSVKFKIPVITPSPVISGQDLSPFVFSYGMTLKQEIRTEMKYAAYAGIRSVSVIYPDNGYGLKIMSYINLYSKKYGVKVLNANGYSGKTVDFFYNFNSLVKFNNIGNTHVSKAEKAQLGITPYNLMHGITKSKPYIPFNGLFVIGNPSKLELILTQLSYYNITGFPIFGLSSLDSRSFMEKYGFYMQNAIFPDGFFKHDEKKIVKKFSSNYKNTYGEMPNILSAEGYDIGGIIIKAAKNMNFSGSAPGMQFYRSLLKIKTFKGVCGTSKLNGGRFKKSLYLFKYKNNKIYILESPF
ncbi:MAG: penicillin-binding protein activator [Deltaproteobacteria bacterium]|nr:penicillin-binding protein activator [Deltaproteobacteria bacterium]